MLAGNPFDLSLRLALSNAMPPDGRIDVYLPSDFTVASAPAVSLVGLSAAQACLDFAHRDIGCPAPAPSGAGPPLIATVTASTRTSASGGALLRVSLACAHTSLHPSFGTCALAPNVAHGLRIRGLRNPRATGTYTIDHVESLDGNGRTADTSKVAGAQPSLSLQVVPNQLVDAAILLADDRIGAITAVNFVFRTTNAIPADGRIHLVFPKGFLFVGPATGFDFAGRIRVTSVGSDADGIARIPGALLIERQGGSLAKAADDSELLIRRNGTSAPTQAGALHSLRVEYVQNPLEPQLTGSFGLSTRTARGERIDVSGSQLRVEIVGRSAEGSMDGRGEVVGAEALPAIATLLAAVLVITGCVTTCVLAPRLRRQLQGWRGFTRGVGPRELGATGRLIGKPGFWRASVLGGGGTSTRRFSAPARRSPRTSRRDSFRSNDLDTLSDRSFDADESVFGEVRPR